VVKKLHLARGSARDARNEDKSGGKRQGSRVKGSEGREDHEGRKGAQGLRAEGYDKEKIIYKRREKCPRKLRKVLL
jgi:hypothetical protein